MTHPFTVASEHCAASCDMAVFLNVQAASFAWFTREEGLRREISRLEDRIHDLEDEKVELVASTSENTRPLTRYVAATVLDLCTTLLIDASN